MGALWKGDGKSTTVQITFHGTWKSTMFHGNSILDDTTIQQLINKHGGCLTVLLGLHQYGWKTYGITEYHAEKMKLFLEYDMM